MMVDRRSCAPRILVAALGCALLIAACGDEEDGVTETTTTAPAPSTSTSTTLDAATTGPADLAPDGAAELLTCLADRGVVVSSRAALREAVAGEDADPEAQRGLSRCVASSESQDTRRPVGSGIPDQPLSVLGGALTVLNGVEGPSMIEHEGRYYLCYSANRWDTADYAVGYAICDSPTGPCGKPEEGPWLAGDGRTAGPGGQEVLVTRRLGVPLLTYHALVRRDDRL